MEYIEKMLFLKITGGSSGIGKELAKKAAERGANVTILARGVTKLEEACKELRTGLNSASQSINFFKGGVKYFKYCNAGVFIGIIKLKVFDCRSSRCDEIRRS